MTRKKVCLTLLGVIGIVLILFIGITSVKGKNEGDLNVDSVKESEPKEATQLIPSMSSLDGYYIGYTNKESQEEKNAIVIVHIDSHDSGNNHVENYFSSYKVDVADNQKVDFKSSITLLDKEPVSQTIYSLHHFGQGGVYSAPFKWGQDGEKAIYDVLIYVISDKNAKQFVFDFDDMNTPVTYVLAKMDESDWNHEQSKLSEITFGQLREDYLVKQLGLTEYDSAVQMASNAAIKYVGITGILIN